MSNLNSYQVYQTKSVFISSGDAFSDQSYTGAFRQISRLHDVTWSINYPLEQNTYLDFGNESFLSSHNAIDCTLGWYHTNGRNEEALGLVDTILPNSALALNLNQEKNIYITMENQLGWDSVGSTGYGQTKTVLALAQGVMTSYNMSARVGGLIESEATMNCLTAVVYSGQSGHAVPTVTHQNGAQLTGLFALPSASNQYNPNGTGLNDPVSAIAARDMIMMFPVGNPFATVFTGDQACYLQSFQCSLTLDRRELKPLGFSYPPHRALLYPIHVDLTTEALVSRYQVDQLSRIDCLGTGQYVNIVVKQPCSNSTLFGLYFNNLQLSSQSFTSSIGPMDTMTTRWKAIISSPTQLFFDPTVNYIVRLDNTGAWGINW